MQRNRRFFLKTCIAGTAGAVGAATFWISTSKRYAARWARTMAADAKRRILPAPQKPTPATWSDNNITVSWLGHATCLINFYGIKILTDPALGKRVGLSLGIATAGPKRYIAPALSAKEVPPIDVLLLSHAHMDHMDLPTMSRFKNAFTVTASLTREIFDSNKRENVHELQWDDSATFKISKGDLQITAFEVRHWGRRWPNDINRGYNGYILRREGKSIIFGGDTAITDSFQPLKSKGPFELAMMPIGAYRPWIWHHCSPEEALTMANDAGAKYIVPIHHQTFKLSDEPMIEPIERFTAALEKEPERIALRQVGATFICPSA
jgi:L-ascorbate metabolism protein UlaG (beta-lactamase superfamily)